MDGWLLLTAVLLLLVGEVMVFNTTYFYAFERFGQSFRFVWKHQSRLFLARLDSSPLLRFRARRIVGSRIRRSCSPSLPCSSCLSRRDAHRCAALDALGPLNFQSSELAKGAIALYLAHSLSRKSERIASFVHGLLPHLVVVGFAVGLIVLEPDLGGAAVISRYFHPFIRVRRTEETLSHVSCQWGLLLCLGLLPPRIA